MRIPPHCDTLDGPVVTAARLALDGGDVSLVLSYVPAAAENEVREAYDKTIKVRTLGGDAREVGNLWFFETVVRLHRAGEGAPYTGLKPAGLDEGPVIPVAEQAIHDEDPSLLIELLTGIVRDETDRRFQDMLTRKAQAGQSGQAARAYVSAMLGLQVWAHKLAIAAQADAHGHNSEREHYH